MKFVSTCVAFLALTALAACDQKEEETTSYGETTDAIEEAAPEVVEEAVDDIATEVETVLDDLKEEATEVIADAVRIDASSLGSFQESLAAMKAALSPEDQSRLATALSSLVAGSGDDESGDVLGSAKSAATGSSMEDTLFNTVGSTLNGMSFEDILALAG